MTKRHFIALADWIRDHNEMAHGHTLPFEQDHIQALALFLGTQNPRFNRQRWLDYVAGTHGPNGGKL